MTINSYDAYKSGNTVAVKVSFQVTTELSAWAAIFGITNNPSVTEVRCADVGFTQKFYMDKNSAFLRAASALPVGTYIVYYVYITN